VWNYLAASVERYDAAIFSLPEYTQPLKVPQRFIMPAIDPFSLINQAMTRREVAQRLERYHIPRDLPLVVQAGRFDKWKDPQGVIDAFTIATRQRAARLVLVGNTAADDPEGPAMYESIRTFSSDAAAFWSPASSKRRSGSPCCWTINACATTWAVARSNGCGATSC